MLKRVENIEPKSSAAIVGLPIAVDLWSKGNKELLSPFGGK